MTTKGHDQEDWEGMDSPEEQADLQPLTPCTRCGWMEDDSSLPLADDMEEYMRCVLGNKKFVKEYCMYDGKLKLTYRILTNKEVDALNGVLFKMADQADHPMVQDSTIKLKLLYFLSKAILGEKEEDYEVPTITKYEEIDDAFNERFGDCPEPVIRMMSQTLMLFMQLQGILVTQGFDENFWQGAGLRSR
jgi:hypothetical protein